MRFSETVILKKKKKGAGGVGYTTVRNFRKKSIIDVNKCRDREEMIQSKEKRNVYKNYIYKKKVIGPANLILCANVCVCIFMS